MQLGDYLDEEFSRPETPSRAAESMEYGSAAAAVYSRGYAPVSSYEPVRAVNGQSVRPAVVPRKQVNMTPETLRMVDELLTQVRTYSMEKDIRNSELFHALVLCVYEARGNLDLSGVPPRGRWGSPTAAALPVALKNAFQDAVARTRQQKR